MLLKRLRAFGPDHQSATSTYGGDQSGTKHYAFNSLGFRGEEFSPDARKRIFVCGCSLTFGVGLDLEETWPHRFREMYAAQLGLASDDVNLLNFSESGCSNDTIVRTMLPQCAALKPDLVLIQFTYLNRLEYLNGPLVIKIGQWLLNQKEIPSESWFTQFQKIVQLYYGFYTAEVGYFSTLKSMLLVQNYCQANSIPYRLWRIVHPETEGEALSENPSCNALEALLDQSCIVQITPELLNLDKAADDLHPGPKAHDAIAQAVFNSFFRASVAARPSRPAVEEYPVIGRSLLEKISHKINKPREDPNIYPLF